MQRPELTRIYRAEHGRVLATVARVVGDLERAEELVQQAWVRALESWPHSGLPEKPGAWLVTAARRLAIDEWRRAERAGREADTQAHAAPTDDPVTRLEEALAPELLHDDPLRLMFTCCYPLLSRDAQAALTLHTLGGLSVTEIAQAFLADERAIAQRLVRAKRTLRARRVPFRVPTAYELPERLPALLEVLYLIFNEGYAASSGEALVRAELCEEALRLAALVADALPAAEAMALVALLELQPRACRRASIPRGGSFCWRIRTARAGAGRASPQASRGSRPLGARRGPVRFSGRRRSPPVMRAPGISPTRTGRASSRATTCCSSSPARPSSR